jgi:Sarcosine oxidase gamma subunit
VLRKLCPVDLADAVRPDGAVFRSLLAGLTATVIRDDVAGERSYLLQCARSYGQYLVDVLLDAGAEFGIEGPNPGGLFTSRSAGAARRGPRFGRPHQVNSQTYE